MFSKSIDKRKPDSVQQSRTSNNERKQIKNLMPTQMFGTSSTIQQNFYLTLGGGQQPFDQSDNTILWSYNIPTLVPNQKKRIIEILYTSAVLKNYQSHQFPQKIGLKAQNVTGFSQLKYEPPFETEPGKWVTQPTNMIAWSNIKNLNSTTSNTNITAYNVVYQNSQDCPWDIGMLPTLVLKVTDQNGVAMPGPFNNPVSIHLRILHVSL